MSVLRFSIIHSVLLRLFCVTGDVLVPACYRRCAPLRPSGSPLRCCCLSRASLITGAFACRVCGKRSASATFCTSVVDGFLDSAWTIPWLAWHDPLRVRRWRLTVGHLNGVDISLRGRIPPSTALPPVCVTPSLPFCAVELQPPSLPRHWICHCLGLLPFACAPRAADGAALLYTGYELACYASAAVTRRITDWPVSVLFALYSC